MLYFKALSFNDKEIFCNFYNTTNTQSYEYLFSSLYLWRNYCRTSYALLNDILIVKKYDENKNFFFMMPFGYNKNDLSIIVETLKNTAPDNTLYLFGDCEDVFIKDLQTNTKYILEVVPDFNCFEYVYLTNDLIKLTGSKYHKKRNHINNFTKNYDYTIKNIDSDIIIKDCLNLVDNWHKTQKICAKELLIEASAIEDILNISSNLNLKTIAVYVRNSLVGFAVGEKVNDTAVIHIERCDKSFLGSYAFLNREFLIKDFSDTKYVNRQEDCGEIGMRQAKQSYYPHHMIEKYLIKVT